MPEELRKVEGIVSYNGNSEFAVNYLTIQMRARKEERMRKNIRSGITRLRRIINRGVVNENAERQEICDRLEVGRKKLVTLIEKYADIAVSGQMRERYMAMCEDLLEIEQQKTKIHFQINKIAVELGISENEARLLMEIRIQDRLAESERKDISRIVRDATGIPLSVFDNDLVYAYQRGRDEFGWRLLEPDEQENTFSLIYSYIFRPHDGTFSEISTKTNSLTNSSLISEETAPNGDNHKVVHHVFADIEARNIEGVRVSFSSSHYCHDPEYPGEDYMAYQLMRQILTFPKKQLAEITKLLEGSKKEE